MTRDQHKREAEKILREREESLLQRDPVEETLRLARAQVHATLALLED